MWRGGGSIFSMLSSKGRIYQAVNVDNHLSINISNFSPMASDFTLTINTTVVEEVSIRS
jgi:hypothetical protein